MIVCKGCGTRMMAKDENGNASCAICIGINKDSGIAIEVNLPAQLRCIDCKRVSETVNLLKRWKSIPFVNPSEGTYYCGCRGWE